MKKINSQNGFTVIELITAAFVFSMILIAATGIYFRVIDAQRRAVASQKIQENVSQLIEIMAKDLKVSQMCPDAQSCTSTNFYIDHPDAGPVYYYLDTARGKIVKTYSGQNVDMTSSEVRFNQFTFVTEGVGCDDVQPKVTLYFNVSDSRNLTTVNLQTTITSRDVREEFTICPP